MNSRLSNMEEHIVLLILEKGFYVYTVCIILVNCELVIYGFYYNEVFSNINANISAVSSMRFDVGFPAP